MRWGTRIDAWLEFPPARALAVLVVGALVAFGCHVGGARRKVRA